MSDLRARLDAARQRSVEAKHRLAAAEEAARCAATLEQQERDVGDANARRDQAVKSHDERADIITSLPTETQLLKLERRLETLKAQLSAAEQDGAQSKTAIDAYTVRRDASDSDRGALADNLEVAFMQAEEGIIGKDKEDRQFAEGLSLLSVNDELTAICDEREELLLELNRNYADRLHEEAELNERIVNIQQQVDAELPKIEADADRYIAALTAAWSTEKDCLQAVYDRLYAVNKEQQHHLVRGTHVKREKHIDGQHEAALSARHNNLSAQLIEARGRLQELVADNTFTRKITDQMRQEGRMAQKSYDAQKHEAGSRLQEARDERVSAEDEARKFRNLKSDLQHALQTIRDTPSGNAKTQ